MRGQVTCLHAKALIFAQLEGQIGMNRATHTCAMTAALALELDKRHCLRKLSAGTRCSSLFLLLLLPSFFPFPLLSPGQRVNGVSG